MAPFTTQDGVGGGDMGSQALQAHICSWLLSYSVRGRGKRPNRVLPLGLLQGFKNLQ